MMKNKYMNLTPEERQSVANAQSLTDIISKKLKETSENAKDGLDLGKIARDLFERKTRGVK